MVGHWQLGIMWLLLSGSAGCIYMSLGLALSCDVNNDNWAIFQCTSEEIQAPVFTGGIVVQSGEISCFQCR